jgi:hypothetical protein
LTDKGTKPECHAAWWAVRLIGSFSYHFWMSDMKPTRRRKGNQHLHRASQEYRDAVRRKLHAYHVFIQAAVVCQGLLQYLAVAFPQRVWDSFGSWLRTVRPGIPPSELVVANALLHSLPEFLLNSAPGNIFAKFVIERQDTDRMETFRFASRAESKQNSGLASHSSMAIFVHVAIDFLQPPIARSAPRHLIPGSRIRVPNGQRDLPKVTSLAPAPSAPT